jgi:hypothetical protein
VWLRYCLSNILAQPTRVVWLKKKKKLTLTSQLPPPPTRASPTRPTRDTDDYTATSASGTSPDTASASSSAQLALPQAAGRLQAGRSLLSLAVARLRCWLLCSPPPLVVLCASRSSYAAAPDHGWKQSGEEKNCPKRHIFTAYCLARLIPLVDC